MFRFNSLMPSALMFLSAEWVQVCHQARLLIIASSFGWDMKPLVLCDARKITQCTYLEEKGFTMVFLVWLAAYCATSPCFNTIIRCYVKYRSHTVPHTLQEILNVETSRTPLNNGYECFIKQPLLLIVYLVAIYIVLMFNLIDVLSFSHRHNPGLLWLRPLLTWSDS